MSGLRGAVADYLTVRRTLGFKLAGAGLLLEQFVDFADAADTDTITTQLAVQWATLPSGSSATWHGHRQVVDLVWWQRGLVVGAIAARYKGYRYPIEVIGHAVWLYHRFGVS